MRHEFTAHIIGITDGASNEADVEPPALVRAEGLSGEAVGFALRGVDKRGAGSWYGRCVKVTIETIGKD